MNIVVTSDQLGTKTPCEYAKIIIKMTGDAFGKS